MHKLSPTATKNAECYRTMTRLWIMKYLYETRTNLKLRSEFTEAPLYAHFCPVVHDPCARLEHALSVISQHAVVLKNRYSHNISQPLETHTIFNERERESIRPRGNVQFTRTGNILRTLSCIYYFFYHVRR